MVNMDQIYLNACHIATKGGSHHSVIELIDKIFTAVNVQACDPHPFIDIFGGSPLGAGCIMLGVHNQNRMTPLAQFLR